MEQKKLNHSEKAVYHWIVVLTIIELRTLLKVTIIIILMFQDTDHNTVHECTMQFIASSIEID